MSAIPTNPDPTTDCTTDATPETLARANGERPTGSRTGETGHLVDRPAWLTDDAWPYPVRSLDVGDLTIAYTDVGSGPTVLLVHVGTWSFVWRDVIAGLRDTHRCVTLDAPVTGLTTGRGATDLDAAARAIDALVTALDLTDVVLVLHDLGGVAALLACERWPGRVRGVVAVNTFGWRPRGAAFRGMLAVMGSAPVRESDAWTGWLPRLTSTRFGVGRHWSRDLRRTFVRGVDRRGRRSFHRYMRSAGRLDGDRLDRAVAQLDHLPLVTVFGSRNDPLGFQPLWRERFTDITQIEVPGGNHFPMCDDPATVATAVTRLTAR